MGIEFMNLLLGSVIFVAGIICAVLILRIIDNFRLKQGQKDWQSAQIRMARLEAQGDALAPRESSQLLLPAPTTEGKVVSLALWLDQRHRQNSEKNGSREGA